MTEKYVVKMELLNKTPVVEISGVRFHELARSAQVLRHALSIEEKYEILIRNYMDLERESLSLSSSEMITGGFEYDTFFEMRSALNLRLVNLLTSIRLYNDQLTNHVASCLPEKDSVKVWVKSLFSEKYDSLFDYRFMEALRNYVQHSGMPVHRVKSGSRWIDDHESLEFSIRFFAQKKTLEADGNFKKSVLNEMPDEVSLKLSVRTYIKAISQIHSDVRSEIKSSVDDARKNFDDTIHEYAELYGAVPFAIYASHFQDEVLKEKVLVFTKWDDVRQRLLSRNGQLPALSRAYVTGSDVESKR